MSTDIRKQLDKLLKRVEKPGRYIGGEINSVIKGINGDNNMHKLSKVIYKIFNE